VGRQPRTRNRRTVAPVRDRSYDVLGDLPLPRGLPDITWVTADRGELSAPSLKHVVDATYIGQRHRFPRTRATFVAHDSRVF
jgi:hypothetical protein